MKFLDAILAKITGKATLAEKLAEAEAGLREIGAKLETALTDLASAISARDTAVADKTKAETDRDAVQGQFAALSTEHKTLKDNFDAQITAKVNEQLQAVGHQPLPLTGKDTPLGDASTLDQFRQEADPIQRGALYLKWEREQSTKQ